MAGTRGVTFHGQGILSEKELAAEPEKEKFTTLARSMADNKVAWVDILKIDVEGAEWTVFMEYFDSGTSYTPIFTVGVSSFLLGVSSCLLFLSKRVWV